VALIIKKFGGTSVANVNLIKNIASIVHKEIKLGNQVVVVVSAMAGTTDNLINLARDISSLDQNDKLAEYDSLISAGEQISSGLVSLSLKELGLNSRSWLGWQLGLLTDSNYSHANILEFDHSILLNYINTGGTPIVAGFQGVDKNNRVTTFGRGASDFTAVFLAYKLEADRCDIYTDVDGVLTADPKIVKQAKKIDYISYDEMQELAKHGAKVLQFQSAVLAKDLKVPVRILSSFSNEDGTTISDYKDKNIMALAIKNIDKDKAEISIVNREIKNNKLIITSITQILHSENVEFIKIIEDNIRISVTLELKYANIAANLIHDNLIYNNKYFSTNRSETLDYGCAQ
jgi:aspartate kinase